MHFSNIFPYLELIILNVEVYSIEIRIIFFFYDCMELWDWPSSRAILMTFVGLAALSLYLSSLAGFTF